MGQHSCQNILQLLSTHPNVPLSDSNPCPLLSPMTIFAECPAVVPSCIAFLDVVFRTFFITSLSRLAISETCLAIFKVTLWPFWLVWPLLVTCQKLLKRLEKHLSFVKSLHNLIVVIAFWPTTWKLCFWSNYGTNPVKKFSTENLRYAAFSHYDWKTIFD